MPYMIGASVTDASAVSKHFEPEIDNRLRAVIAAEKPTAQERAAIPRTLRIGCPKGKDLPAIISWSTGPFIVSPRLRDILEELEPGRQDFLSIHIKTEKELNGALNHGDYYLIIAPPRLDAIVIEETQFAKGYGREGFERSGRVSYEKDDPCVLNGRVIEGHHFWQSPDRFGAKPNNPLSGQTAFFCSDELWKRISTEKLKGWDIEKICTVKDT